MKPKIRIAIFNNGWYQATKENGAVTVEGKEDNDFDVDLDVIHEAFEHIERGIYKK